MKLYATTTSERASKGQGGNKLVITNYQDLNEDTILNITIEVGNISDDGMQEYLISVDGAINKKVCHWSRTKDEPCKDGCTTSRTTGCCIVCGKYYNRA